MPLTAGTRLGVYEILAPLGAGGMGEVYRARDTKLGRDVALKTLPDALARDLDRIARFEREAKVLASLNHPHIAVLYGFEESGGQHFLVMELVEGETLDARLRARDPSDIGARGSSRAMPLVEALAIARQIADALEAAHEKGIVHRDLKPANVKLTPDDRVKVLDFGLAKAMSPPNAGPDSGAADLTHSPTLTFAGATQAGMILGTAPYMSPEQAKGRMADRRSDVWAFGCVLYEMLAGRRAFEGDDVSEVLASVIKSDPDWTALPSSVPQTIRTLIQGCLKKDRKERIGDISTALFLMNQPPALASTAVASQPPSIWRRALPVAAGVAIGAAAVAAFSLRPKPSAPIPVTRFSMTLPQGQQVALPRQAVAISADGRHIAYAAADGQLYLRSMSESEARAIRGAHGAGPVFSPDGQSLLYAGDSGLKRIPIGGGTATTICPASPAPSGTTWTSDGILFALAGTGILRVSASGGEPEVVVPIKPSEGLALGPQQLPGGFLLYTVVSASQRGADFPWDHAQIVVQSLATGERRTIIEPGADARYVPTGHLVYAVSGTLFAVPFDIAKLAVTGAAVPIVEGVARANSITSGSAHYAFSDSGSMVYLPGPAAAGRLEVTLFDRKGAAEALKLPAGSYAHPRVSPDGKRLALETRDAKETNVSIYELSGASAVRRLTFGGNNRFPIWSADGRRVVFQSDREGDGAVYSQLADGGTAERLTKPEPGTVHVPESWSPTGDVFLFSIVKQSDVSLWIFDTRDRKAAPFGDVRSSSTATAAVFSPNGRWVAYQFGEQRQAEATTYVQPFPPNGKKYQIARGGRPAWSGDGSKLFYVPAPGQFAAVKVTTQPTFEISNPMPVHRGFGVADPGSPRPYDVTPDGRFVGIGTGAQPGVGLPGPAQLQIVINWFEDLKARVAAR